MKILKKAKTTPLQRNQLCLGKSDEEDVYRSQQENQIAKV